MGDPGIAISSSAAGSLATPSATIPCLDQVLAGGRRGRSAGVRPAIGPKTRRFSLGASHGRVTFSNPRAAQAPVFGVAHVAHAGRVEMGEAASVVPRPEWADWRSGTSFISRLSRHSVRCARDARALRGAATCFRYWRVREERKERQGLHEGHRRRRHGVVERVSPPAYEAWAKMGIAEERAGLLSLSVVQALVGEPTTVLSAGLCAPMTPLRFASPLPPSGWIEDLHLQAVGHARHTKRGRPEGRPRSYSV